MDIWAISTYWLLWVMLIFTYCFPCGHMFSFLLGVHLGVEFLAQTISLCLIVWETARLFSKEAAPFYISTHSVCGFKFLCQHLLLSDFSILASLVGMKWYLTVVLICFPLMTTDVEYLFMCHLYIFHGEMYRIPFLNWVSSLLIIIIIVIVTF